MGWGDLQTCQKPQQHPIPPPLALTLDLGHLGIPSALPNPVHVTARPRVLGRLRTVPQRPHSSRSSRSPHAALTLAARRLSLHPADVDTAWPHVLQMPGTGTAHADSPHSAAHKPMPGFPETGPETEGAVSWQGTGQEGLTWPDPVASHLPPCRGEAGPRPAPPSAFVLRVPPALTGWLRAAGSAHQVGTLYSPENPS